MARNEPAREPTERTPCAGCQQLVADASLEAFDFGAGRWVFLCRDCLGLVCQQAIEALSEAKREALYGAILTGRFR
ncbi:MAG: hypothetical protein IT210_11840 [Armatimonadetes bacterium]|nr:hypothetical protein [Armatimonadota bacterium]